VELSDEQADRIQEGMDKTSTHSNVQVTVLDEVDTDFATLNKLIADIEAQQKIVEKRRKS
jgi:hypothetical protein